MVKDIKISEYNYSLPDDRIPRHPLEKRDACRLLVSEDNKPLAHKYFSELPSLLKPQTLLVCNDTKVINARLEFHKQTGARIEIFLLEPVDPSDYVLTFQTRGECIWKCMIGNLKKWKDEKLTLEIMPKGMSSSVLLTAQRLAPLGGNSHEVRFSWDNPDVTFASVVETAGNIPIPPYLKRASGQSDLSDYQTVYADAKGSVAAPTAGLHFTPEVFEALFTKGIDVAKLTLHVGAGTFQPVKSENIGDHPMHTETFSVTRNLVEKLLKQKRKGKPVIAVGTTSVRTLETLPVLGMALASDDKSLHVDQWEAYEPEYLRKNTEEGLEALLEWMDRNAHDSITATTAIMIAPGFRWRIVDGMVTNFHQPESTLLLLVSSFLGEDKNGPKWRTVYNEALAGDYRFLSYGDACLFL